MNRNIAENLWRWAAPLCICFLLGSTARGEFLGSAVTISVTAGSDSGFYEVELPSSADPLDWSLSQPVEVLNASGDSLAHIASLSFELNGDPAVSLNFSITAGSSPTLITISSSTISFTPIINAQAFATAALTVTDFNGNGATATGTFAGAKAYEARYNGSGVFADLVSPVVAGMNASNIGTERFPITGNAGIGPMVSTIESQFSFTLSAHDSASGTSRFNVIPGPNVPEPSSFVLAALGLGGTYLRIRRHRR